jgi:uncharacterized membrane protein YeaQ/YmgE (transglycosylase-associated protein family)
MKVLAHYGTVLSSVLGIIPAYVHAFWSQNPDDHVIEHILWTIIFRVVVGAALLAAVAAIRNWLVRRPGDPVKGQ